MQHRLHWGSIHCCFWNSHSFTHNRRGFYWCLWSPQRKPYRRAGFSRILNCQLCGIFTPWTFWFLNPKAIKLLQKQSITCQLLQRSSNDYDSFCISFVSKPCVRQIVNDFMPPFLLFFQFSLFVYFIFIFINHHVLFLVLFHSCSFTYTFYFLHIEHCSV